MHQIWHQTLRYWKYISNKHFKKLKWLPINQRLKQYVTSREFTLVQNKCPAWMNKIFIPTEDIKISTRKSYLKLKHPQKSCTCQSSYCTCCLEWNLRNIEENKKIWILSNKRWTNTNWIIPFIKILEMLVSMVKFSLTILFKNPVPDETACFIIDLLFWMEFQKYWIKQENLNTFKNKMKHYYLNNLSNQNLGNVGGYALAIIKIIFLFIKQRFLHFSSLLLHSDWNTMNVRLFACFALHLPYCFSSLILLLTSKTCLLLFFYSLVIINFLYLFGCSECNLEF